MVQGLDMRFLGGKVGLKNMVKTRVIESVFCTPDFVHALGSAAGCFAAAWTGWGPLYSEATARAIGTEWQERFESKKGEDLVEK